MRSAPTRSPTALLKPPTLGRLVKPLSTARPLGVGRPVVGWETEHRSCSQTAPYAAAVITA